MITLSKFERLVMTNIAQKPVQNMAIGVDGELISEWILSLSGMNKHGQFAQMQSVLSDLLVAQMSDKLRLSLLAKLMPAFERVVGQLHNDYIYEHQNLSAVQQQSTTEVRSLYFLLILNYKNIASRAYVELHQDDDVDSWLKKIVKTLNHDEKDTIVIAVYQMIGLYVRLLMEYAMTYQRAPRVVWQQLNFWYLRVAQEGVVHQDVHKVAKYLPNDTIHRKYEQACISSFVNFFAYRRQDILAVFKVLPTWASYVEATFEARPELKIFVNLLGNHPPEMITPYATVNPYSDEYQCLFFDETRLVEHLLEVKSGKFITNDAQSVFESRLAQMVLIAFERYARQDRIDRLGEQKAELLTGFSAIFKEVSGGRGLGEVINQKALMNTHQPKSVKEALNPAMPKEQVKLTSSSDTLARFNYTQKIHDTHDDLRDVVINQQFLQVFGLFAIKSDNSKNHNPWRLGIAHWVDRFADEIEVDGRILGRILLACGARLLKNDARSQEFIHALLIDGDELNRQSTLIVPRYHFKSGDMILMRIDTKELQLRLERNLLSTDEIEQYQIVRISNEK